MAQGPDPNRWQRPEPELSPDDEVPGGGIEDLPSTRVGLPSWGIVLLVAVLTAVVVWMLL